MFLPKLTFVDNINPILRPRLDPTRQNTLGSEPGPDPAYLLDCGKGLGYGFLNKYHLKNAFFVG